MQHSRSGNFYVVECFWQGALGKSSPINSSTSWLKRADLLHWNITFDFQLAERLSLSGAERALRSDRAVRMLEEGVKIRIVEVRATYSLKKVWPLSALEELASQAD